MKQITDDMVRMIMRGGGVHLEGFLLNMKPGPFPKSPQYLATTLQAVSKDGRTHTRQVMPINLDQIKTAIQGILHDINSRTHLPESAYNNGIRLDTEHRCQNQRCNPAGKRRLLFVSAGPMAQAMQVKCKCGYMNTFWNNRIDFDEYGAIFMKKNGS